jgi:hypothetical protein
MTVPDSGESKDLDPYELAALLYAVCYDLHPTYANTSCRGRGIGGQMVTTQCNYVDPEGDEFYLLGRIEDVIHQWYRQAERKGVNMTEVKTRALKAAKTAMYGYTGD